MAAGTDAVVRVLSVSPIEEDHLALNRIFKRSDWSGYTESKWVLHPTLTLESAVASLRASRYPLVLSERDLLPGTWREMLEETVSLPDPPVVIVTSRMADDYLWAEALNLGAYDVLAKPFDANEVIRGLSLAWHHWRERQSIDSSPCGQTLAATGT